VQGLWARVKRKGQGKGDVLKDETEGLRQEGHTSKGCAQGWDGRVATLQECRSRTASGSL
jgi:hypothetical protein